MYPKQRRNMTLTKYQSKTVVNAIMHTDSSVNTYICTCRIIDVQTYMHAYVHNKT